MLNVSGTTRVLVATTPVDLRGSFNRLYSLVVEQLKGDPLSGQSVRIHQPAAESDQDALAGTGRVYGFVPSDWNKDDSPGR